MCESNKKMGCELWEMYIGEGITLILLIISELLPFINGTENNGILHYVSNILTKVQKRIAEKSDKKTEEEEEEEEAEPVGR